MPNQIEPNANNALGNLLRGMMPTCEVRSENTQTFPDHPGRHADVLVTAAGRSPVVVEAEYVPAAEVEKDAAERLGLRVEGVPRTIEAAIALRYPQAIEEAYDVTQAVGDARLSYCVLHEDGTRFPESGWLGGSAADLAVLIRLVSVPRKEVDQAAVTMEEGINRAANLLEDAARARPATIDAIASRMGMKNVPQARRMACAIISNAMVFHERIAGVHKGIKPLNQVCGPDVADPQRETLDAWATILDINYLPVFAVGRDILKELQAGDAAFMLRMLYMSASGVSAVGVDNAHDLTGRVFQRLISDRKFLATFYTLPPSAALLANLAVDKMTGVDWADADAVAGLRVADFACGTGALLSAVYEQVASRHERAGGDFAKLHPRMMEDVLHGCDVMPSAIHITSSTLAGLEPSIGYTRSQTHSVPYGRLKDGSVKLGSLELLQSSTLVDGEISIDVPDEGFDLVIMNPPFTRNVTREGATAHAIAAAFAAFGATEIDQRDMTERMSHLKGDSCYHGNAGMGTGFAGLADKKLKPGGVLALVLPLSVASGKAWQRFRQMLADHYNELTVVSISANGKKMSFSSDTGMAECLVIARKAMAEGSSSDTRRARFVSLRARPQEFAAANELAKQIRNAVAPRHIEDGPFGGTPISVGTGIVGEVAASEVSPGDAWGGVRLSDYALAQTAHGLSVSGLWLPGSSSTVPLAMTDLSEVSNLGSYHLDIIGPAPRGPFDKEPPSPTATYPALWNHDATQETRMICKPDSQLRMRPGLDKKGNSLWKTASRAHLNLDFTFGSQALAVAFTEKVSLGGRVWPNVVLQDSRFDYVFAIWGNSTLGLLSWWWHSNRQQSSKAGMTVTSAPSMPVLDFRALSNEQLGRAEGIFEEFRDKELQPAYLADADPNRALLDRRVVCDLLGFDEETYQGVRRLAAKWCAEPSVHGGKKRPKGATFIA